MNLRVILYAIVGGFLTFYGIGLYIERHVLYGVPLAIIGLFIGLQMIRMLMLPETKNNRPNNRKTR